MHERYCFQSTQQSVFRRGNEYKIRTDKRTRKQNSNQAAVAHATKENREGHLAARSRERRFIIQG